MCVCVTELCIILEVTVTVKKSSHSNHQRPTVALFTQLDVIQDEQVEAVKSRIPVSGSVK